MSLSAKLDNSDVTTARALVPAVTYRVIAVKSMILTVASAGTYWFEDGDATQVGCKHTLAANGQVSHNFGGDGLQTTVINKALNLKGSASGVVGCTIIYDTVEI